MGREPIGVHRRNDISTKRGVKGPFDGLMISYPNHAFGKTKAEVFPSFFPSSICPPSSHLQMPEC